MKKSNYTFIFSLLLFLSINLFSQTFTEQTGISLQSVSGSSVAWGDYDNDGDLDILLTGFYGQAKSKIYKNNGNNTFSEQTSISLTGVFMGSAAWGDYDNDGDLDVLLTGYVGNTNSTPCTKIYKNNGNNSFSEQTSISLLNVAKSDAVWGDYDNDGDLDILLTGTTDGYTSGAISKIYKNNGNNSFSLQTSINLPGVYLSSVAWGDYDKDGYLDILLTGDSNSGSISKVFRNNGNNGFYEPTGFFINGVEDGSVAWGDYDNDGDLDILLTGYLANIGNISKIYKNDGNIFTEQTNISLTGVMASSVVWGDYDNDGDLDILLTGSTGSSIYVTKIYKNNGTNNFVEQVGIGLAGVGIGSVAWGDYDNDGDLDILMAGTNGSTVTSKIYKNDIINSNSGPTAPNGLSAQIVGNMMRFSWNRSTDNNTPSNALNYNIRIGTTPNGIDINSPESDINSGFHRIAVRGMIQDTFFYQSLQSFPSFYAIYYSVQAIDNGFQASAFSQPSLTGIPPIGYLPNDTSINCGSGMQLNVYITNGNANSLTYSWSPLAGLWNPYIRNPIATPTTTTWYKVIATSPLGYTFTDSVLITVLPMQINANNITKNCDSIANFGASINFSSPNIQYSWSPTVGLSNPTILNPSVNPIHTTTYILNAVDGYCTATDTVVVTVNPANWNPDFSANQTQLTAPPFVFNFTNATDNKNDYNFTWDFGDGMVLNSNDTSVSHTYAYNGYYSVSLTATHKTNSCPDSILKTNYIYCTGGTSIDFNYQNGDEINVDLFPNPNQGDFTLVLNGTSFESHQIQVLTVVGEVIYTETLKSSGGRINKEIHLNDISKGLYFVSIISNEGRVVKRFVVQ